jgi:hypothetical protein
METEFRNISKEKADIEAIGVLLKILRQLLLGSPLGEKMFWQLILDSERDVRSYVSTSRVILFIMKQFILIRLRMKLQCR